MTAYQVAVALARARCPYSDDVVGSIDESARSNWVEGHAAGLLGLPEDVAQDAVLTEVGDEPDQCTRYADEGYRAAGDDSCGCYAQEGLFAGREEWRSAAEGWASSRDGWRSAAEAWKCVAEGRAAQEASAPAGIAQAVG